MREHCPDQDVEQFIVSASVIRQSEHLSPELVEHHKQILESYGVVGQALHTLLAIPQQGWMDLLDRLQRHR